MDGWNNVRIYLLRTVLTTGAALVSVAALRAEMLTSPALPTPGAEASATHGFVPLTHNAGVRGNASKESAAAWLRAFGMRLAEFRRELVTELVATQLTMIGGHPTPPPVTVTSTPPVTVTNTPPVTPPPTTTTPPVPPGPPVPTGNPPPPPSPPPPPGPPIPTGGGQPPDGTPPPPPDSPEPASLVLGLLGAGLASLTAWRRRNTAQRAV